MKLLTIVDHTFVASSITPGKVVLDLGVNLGQFGAALADGFGAKVYGVEADQRLFEASSASRWPFPVIHAAVMARPGRVLLHLNGENFCPSVLYEKSATSPPALEVEGCTLQQLWDRWQLGEVELMKIDIEGAEVDVLLEAPEPLLSKINQITCEFHDFMDPASLTGIRRVCARMQQLNFRVIRFSSGHYGNVLFLNRRLRAFDTPSAGLQIWLYRTLRSLKQRLSESAE